MTMNYYNVIVIIIWFTIHFS